MLRGAPLFNVPEVFNLDIPSGSTFGGGDMNLRIPSPHITGMSSSFAFGGLFGVFGYVIVFLAFNVLLIGLGGLIFAVLKIKRIIARNLPKPTSN